MKSLEHIIREIREGKAEKGSKKTLEGSIRKVMKGEKESSFADRTTKPITDDVGGLAGSGTGGEPKLHAEAIGVIGTDDYKGSQPFKAVPHIKPPAGSGSHSQAPENVSRQRTLAKERSSMTLHGKVTEEKIDEVAPLIAAPVIASLASPYVAPMLGATAAGVAGYLATRGKGKLPSFKSYDPEKAKQNDSYSTAAERMKTMKFDPAKPVEAPKPDEAKPAAPTEPAPVAPVPAKPKEPKKAPAQPEETPKAPPVTIPAPKAPTVPSEPPAKAIPAPQAPKPIEMPPPYRTQPQQPAKEKEKTPAETPKRWKEIGPPMPAETRPEVKPAAAPDTKTKPEIKTGVVQLPAIDIGTRTAAKTDVAPATAAKTATDTATTTSEPEEKNRFPLSFGATAMPDVFGAQKGITSKHPVASRARGHRRHVSEEVANEIRKKIQNMPRPDAGDRKSIEYVGRKDSDPKSDKQKTSRLATIKNVIDEAKKIKFEAEFGKEKKYVYPNDTEVVIGPNMKRNFLDVEDSKLPKDYENK